MTTRSATAEDKSVVVDFLEDADPEILYKEDGNGSFTNRLYKEDGNGSFTNRLNKEDGSGGFMNRYKEDGSGSFINRLKKEDGSGGFMNRLYQEDGNGNLMNRHKSQFAKTQDASSLSSATHARGVEEEAKDNNSSWHREKKGKRSPRRGKATTMSANQEEAKYEQEKHERTYQKWQDFKEHQKEERLAQLKNKIALQHELIKARDERHLQLISQEEQRLSQAREQQKAVKQEREAALVQHCKEELVREKKANLVRRSEQQEQPEVEDNTQETAEDIVASIPSSSMISHPHRLSVIQSREDEQQRALSAPMDEEESAKASIQVDDDPALHKDHLYHMFGKKQADYFLYPRIEPQKPKRIRIPPSVRKQGGRAGAHILWETLRDKSSVRLKRADASIPKELTDAYGAFVRECLTNNKTVAARGFYSEEGIPENERIQDKSYSQKMKELRHHMQLMYRSSQANEDKTSILMFNNPMPDFSDREGVEGPERYWPSWVHQEEDPEDEPEYKKWLKEVASPWPQNTPENLPSTPPELKEKWKKQRRLQTPEADKNDTDGAEGAEIDVVLPDIPFGKPKDKSKKISFLTEEDARCEGQFRKKFEKMDGPKPYVPGTDVMKTAGLPIEEKPKDKGTSKSRGSKESQRRSHTAPATVHSDRGGGGDTRRRRPPGSAPWQPLSMNALNDYKPATVLFGQGDYAHGQDAMWKPVLASNTTKQ